MFNQLGAYLKETLGKIFGVLACRKLSGQG